jgi:UDP-GlcNAc:undecaprenyl-phosphate/decaprenyl-phosphate GlcNAc-1-phosphate transferase
MRGDDPEHALNALAGVFIVAALTALVLTPLVALAARRCGALDHPGARRAHAASMPRLGGIAVTISWLGVVVGTALSGDAGLRTALADMPLVSIAAATLLVFALGLVDDLRPVPPWIKILIELLAAGALVRAGIVIDRVTVAGTTYSLGSMSAAVTVVWLLGITNAFNLLDGLDGLATGLAIIAGTTCAAILVIRGEAASAVLLVALIGALVGFLPFNFNPATIFLGDCGSLVIGFVLATTAITGLQKGATALAAGVPLLIFALPIYDMATTVLRRLVRGGPRLGRNVSGAIAHVLSPDREHVHHRLMSGGLSHRSAVLVLYAIAIGLAGVAMVTMAAP